MARQTSIRGGKGFLWPNAEANATSRPNAIAWSFAVQTDIANCGPKRKAVDAYPAPRQALRHTSGPSLRIQVRLCGESIPSYTTTAFRITGIIRIRKLPASNGPGICFSCLARLCSMQYSAYGGSLAKGTVPNADSRFLWVPEIVSPEAEALHRAETTIKPRVRLFLWLVPSCNYDSSPTAVGSGGLQ